LEILTYVLLLKFFFFFLGGLESIICYF
jgi:hypothetical protein